MNLSEKQNIAAIARTLIRLLQECDDDDFVDLVTSCVASGYDFSLEVENL